jgi:hypothetical protein
MIFRRPNAIKAWKEYPDEDAIGILASTPMKFQDRFSALKEYYPNAEFLRVEYIYPPTTIYVVKLNELRRNDIMSKQKFRDIVWEYVENGRFINPCLKNVRKLIYKEVKILHNLQKELKTKQYAIEVLIYIVDECEKLGITNEVLNEENVPLPDSKTLKDEVNYLYLYFFYKMVNVIVEKKYKEYIKIEVDTMNKTNKINQNQQKLGGDYEYYYDNSIEEFISDNDSYSHLDTDNFIDNMEDNPSYLAFVVEKTAEDNYIEETDVGGDGYYKLCLQIIIENIREDMQDDVRDIIRNLYI